MSNEWFECRISYDKTMENGVLKKVTEAYLVEAMNFTEAEKRITEEMQPFISGEFTVSVCNRRKYEEVITGEYEFYYRVKLIVTTIDEKTAAEKHSNMFMLVNANDLIDAVTYARDWLRGTMLDYKFHTVSETAILDVFKR